MPVKRKPRPLCAFCQQHRVKEAKKTFCSRLCASKARRQVRPDPERTCLGCNKPITRRPGERWFNYARRKFCHKQCQLDAMTRNYAAMRVNKPKRKRKKPSPPMSVRRRTPNKPQKRDHSYHKAIRTTAWPDPRQPRWDASPMVVGDRLVTGTCTNEIVVIGKVEICGRELNAFGVCSRCSQRQSWLKGQRAEVGINVGQRIVRRAD